MELEGRNVLVVGFGRTGKSLSRFLLGQGARVTVNDIKRADEIHDNFSEYKERGARFVLGSHPTDLFAQQDLIVISPGVDPVLPGLRAARTKGIPIISEIEMACQFITAPIIGITGTNGKTTTSTLIHELLRASGFSVYLGGNIGIPLIDFVTQRLTAEYLVVELSSFQLEGIVAFKPYLGVLLNITEDHLNRYESFTAYRDIKFRLFMNQTDHEMALINYDDRHCRAILPSLGARLLPFSRIQPLGEGIYAQGQQICYCGRDGSRQSYDLSQVKLLGPHNVENFLASIGVAAVCGCDQEKTQKAVSAFTGLEHRLEYVRTIGGISFYNDSKSTTIDSTLKALQSFPGNVILIAGGREKGGDYSVLVREIQHRTKLLIVIGEAQEKFAALFGFLVPTERGADMADAVVRAFHAAQPGDVVLLSPGCASFDMFANYEERGRVFKEVVHRLAPAVSAGKESREE